MLLSRRRHILVLWCSLLCSVLIAPRAHAQPVTPDPQLTIAQLANGLRYAIRPCRDPAHAISIILHIDAGSLREADDQPGAARIAAGLAARGSKTVDPPTLNAIFEQLGLSAATDLRTAVAYERATVRIDLPPAADPPTNIQPLLAYLASLIDPDAGPIASDHEVNRQRRQITNADVATANASTRLSAKALPVLLPEARINVRPPRDIPGIEHTTAAQVQAFLRDNYTPAGAILVVTGEFQPEQLALLIEATFAPLRATPPRNPCEAHLGTPAKPVVAIEQEPEFIKDAVQLLAFTDANPPVVNRQAAREQLAARLTFAALTDRIAELAQDKENPIRAGAAFSLNNATTMRMSSVMLMGEPNTWPKLTELAITELRRAIAHGFDEHMLASTKARLIASLDRAALESNTNAPALADRIADQLARGDTPTDAAQDAALARDLLQDIAADDIKRTMANLLDPARAGYLVVTPTPAASDTQKVQRRMSAALKKSPPPVRSEPLPQHLFDAPPTPGQITRLTLDPHAAVLSAQCAGGVRIHVHALDAATGRAAVALAISGGKINETTHTRGLTNALATLWARPAVAGHSNIQTERVLAAHGVRISGAITDDALCIIAEAPADQLNIALEFLRGVIEQPAPDPKTFEDIRALIAASAAARAQRPLGALDQVATQALFPSDDPRHQPLSADEITALSADQLAAWAHHLFASGDIDIALVGDISRAKAAETAAAVLGGLKRPIRAPQEPIHLQLPLGPIAANAESPLATPQAAVAVGFRGPDRADHRDLLHAELAAIALTERLTRRLRDQENLAPIINVESRPADTYLGSGRFQVTATTDPTKTTTLVDRIRSELDAFSREGPQPAELRAAKLRLKGLWHTQLEDPAYWARDLAIARLRNQPLDLLTDTLDRIDQTTAADLTAFLRRYDKPSQRFTAVVHPTNPQTHTPSD